MPFEHLPVQRTRCRRHTRRAPEWRRSFCKRSSLETCTCDYRTSGHEPRADAEDSGTGIRRSRCWAWPASPPGHWCQLQCGQLQRNPRTSSVKELALWAPSLGSVWLRLRSRFMYLLFYTWKTLVGLAEVVFARWGLSSLVGFPSPTSQKTAPSFTLCFECCPSRLPGMASICRSLSLTVFVLPRAIWALPYCPDAQVKNFLLSLEAT